MKYMSGFLEVYECEYCGERIIIDMRTGEQPPTKCPDCGRISPEDMPEEDER